MVNRYRNVKLPSWVKDAPRERLIAHMQYLTNQRDVQRKALEKARYRYRKAEKQLEELSKGEMKDSLDAYNDAMTEMMHDHDWS